MSFKKYKADPTLHFMKQVKIFEFLIVYVDKIILTEKAKKEIEDIIGRFKQDCEIRF